MRLQRKDKALFIRLVKAFNKACAKEHASYLRRGTGGKNDWYKIRDELDKAITQANTVFKKAFRKYIDKAEYKNFNLGNYNTEDPELLREVMWMSWQNEEELDLYIGY